MNSKIRIKNGLVEIMPNHNEKPLLIRKNITDNSKITIFEGLPSITKLTPFINISTEQLKLILQNIQPILKSLDKEIDTNEWTIKAPNKTKRNTK